MKYLPLALLILFFSCQKEPKYSEIVQPDKSLLAHFNYKPGSYWILEDSATGQLDSLYVLTNERLEYVSDYTKLIVRQQIEFSTFKKGTDIIDWKVYLGQNQFGLFEFRNDEHNDYPILFLYPFKDTAFILSDTILFKKLPQFNCSGGQYMNVLQVHNYLSVYIGAANIFKPHDHWFWINESYGFIKMSLRYHDGKQICWTLKRRKIVL